MQKFTEKEFFDVVRGTQKSENKILNVYKDLVFNRFYESLSYAFPLTEYFIGEDIFSEYVESFIKLNSHHPILWKNSKQFMEFVLQKSMENKDIPEFILELVYFEWLEIELFNEIEDKTDNIKFDWNKRYKLNNNVRLNKYMYPVHKAKDLERDEIISQKGIYHLLIFRNSKYEIQSVELTEFIFKLLIKISYGKKPDESLYIKEKGISREELIPYLDKFFNDLIDKNILCLS